MKTQVDHVLHLALRNQSPNPITALYFGYDNIFDTLFSYTGIKLYTLAPNQQIYQCPCELPKNYTTLERGPFMLPNRIDFDVIIANHRKGQVFKAEEVANFYHVPLVLIEHELPASNSKIKIREYVNTRMPKQCNHVIPHQIVKDEWHMTNDTILIPYGVPNKIHVVAPNKNKTLLVVGDYIPPLYSTLRTLCQSDSDSWSIGHNQNITKAYGNVSEIISAMEHSLYTTMFCMDTQPPLLALLAMASRSLVLVNKTKWTERIIEHEVNGLLYDDVHQVKNILRSIKKDPIKANKIIDNAREYVSTYYNMNSFINKWTETINTLNKKVYIR